MNVAQPIAGDVCINLRRADVRVAEQFLNHPQIRAVLQQMRGKTVPQHVRCDVAHDPGPLDSIFNPQPQRHGCEWCATLRQKNIGRRPWRDEFGSATFNVTVQRCHGYFPDRYDALLVAFADDVDKAGIEVKLFQAQIAKLREPQTGGVSQFKNRLVAQTSRRGLFC